MARDNEQTANVVLTADTSAYQRDMGEANRSTLLVLDSVARLSTALNNLSKSAGRKFEIVSAVGMAGLAGATKLAADFESKMETLSAQSVLAGRNFEALSKQTQALARNTGVTTDEIIGLITQLSKLGQGQYNIERIGKTFIQLGAVTGESVSGLANGLIQLQRQMNTGGERQTERFASALAQLSGKAGVSAQSILEFANAIAPIAKVAGISQTEVMGISTAFTKAGADGYLAASAFNKMLTDITRSIQYGSPELGAYANLIGKTREEFQKMDKTTALTEIFETINSQGQGAIKTLDRLGLDGIRTIKSIQAVASSGGIRQAVEEANTGYSDTAKFTKAAETAMDGLNESAQRLRNTMGQIGQAFGSAFVGPLTTVTNAINGVLSPLASFLSMLGSIPGMAALGGVAVTALAGTALRHAALLSGVALARQMTGGVMARGFQMGRSNDMAGGIAGRVGASQARMTGTQRFFYGMGHWAGEAMGPPTEGAGPGGLRSAWNRANRFGSSVLGGAGRFIRGQFESLYPGNLYNPANMGAESNARPFNEAVSRRGFTMPGVMGAATADNMNKAGQGAANSLKDSGNAAKAHANMLKTAGTEIGKTIGSITKAGVGAGMLATEFAGKTVMPSMGRAVGRGLRGAASSLGEFMGGPWGIALAGVGVAGYLNSAVQANQERTREIGAGATDVNAAGGAYRAALGEAALATTTFADVVKRNAASISGKFQGQITPGMVKEAVTPGREYTNPEVGTMSEAQLKVYAQNMSGASDEAKELFAYDLAKRFGSTRLAQPYLDLVSKGGTQDWRSVWSGMQGTNWLGTEYTPQSFEAQQRAIAMTRQGLAAAEEAGGPAEAGRFMMAQLGAATKAIPKANTGQLVDSWMRSMGLDPNDPKEREKWERVFGKGVAGRFEEPWQAQDRAYGVLEDLAKSGQLPPSMQPLWEAVRAGGGRQALETTTYTPSGNLAAQNPFLTGGVGSQVLNNVITSGALGQQAMNIGTGTGSRILASLQQPGNQNLLYQASQDLARDAKSMSGSFAASIGELQRFRAAVGDVNDPLAQLAANAMTLLRAQQREAMFYMTPSQQLRQQTQLYGQSRANAEMPGAASDAQAIAEQDRQAMVAAQQAAYQRVGQIAAMYKQLETTEKYMAADFAKAVSRASQSHALQTQYAREDYATSRERSIQQFNLSRERAEYEFNLQRQRNESAYQRQLTRGLRDYNLSRLHAQQDFDRQRIYAEKDFNHQVELMARQTAKTVMNIYERVRVQQTWSAGNLLSNMNDQLNRLQEQQENLAKLRSQGLSGQAISMLGLNDPQNAQQLARFLDDTMNNPALIEQFNKAVRDRMSAAMDVVTDQDNEQWQEMNYQFQLQQDRSLEQFNLTMDRQAQAFSTQLADMREDHQRQLAESYTDFTRMRKQQAEDFARQMAWAATDFQKQIDRNNKNFAISMAQMNEDYQTQIKRGRQAFQDAATDLSVYIAEYAEKASKALTGQAKTEFDALLRALKQAGIDIGIQMATIMASVDASVQLGLAGIAKLDAAAAAAATRATKWQTELYPSSTGSGGTSGVVKAGYITQSYGPPRHYGVDIGGNPAGTPIYSYKSGKVIYRGYQAGGFGNHVRVDHGGGLYTIYGHMSSYNVGSGQAVGAGTKLGGVGSTGRSTGNHLHYEVRKGNAYSLNAAVNPMPYFRYKSMGGLIPGVGGMGDTVPVMAEPGEYVIPRFRVRETGERFFDALRTQGLAGVKQALVNGNSVPSQVSTSNYYTRIDKSTNFSGPIHVTAADPAELVRKIEEQRRLKALIGRR